MKTKILNALKQIPKSSVSKYVLLAAILIAIFPVAMGKNYYFLFLAYSILLYTVMASSWNIISGFCGQVSLAHAAFFGIGAYSTGLVWLTWNPGIYPFVGMLLGGLLAAGFAAIVGFPLFRLRGVYFTVGSVGAAEALRVLLSMWRDVIGGFEGRYLPIWPKFPLSYTFYACAILALATVIASYLIKNSKLGLGFVAIREDEEAASSLGINIRKYKIIALVLSSVFPAIAGGIYAVHTIYIQPTNIFGTSWTITSVLMASIGGAGTVLGPIIGAAVYILTREYFTVTLTAISSLPIVVFGGALVVIKLTSPGGLEALVKKAYNFLMKRISS